jgi:hypothetical protein
MILCAAGLSLLGVTAGCKNRPVEPKGPSQIRSGAATTAAGCLGGLVNSLTMTVKNLHFRTTCQRNASTSEFSFAYQFRDDTFTGESGSLEGCIDKLASSLNTNIPYMDIPLADRCTRRIKVYSSERLLWAYEYSGVL